MSQLINLPVSDNHVLNIERSGNPSGIPVILLHGGPGSGSNPENKHLFDPKFFDIFIYDQRGCGQSTPTADILNNTTQLLVSDIRSILNHFQIKKAMFVGGSWGATLALIYAKKYPDSVLALVLRGSFLARRQDIEWFISDNGVARLIPKKYSEFFEAINKLGPVDDMESLVNRVFSSLISNDEKLRSQAAIAWAKWSWAVLNYSFEKNIEFSIESIERIFPNVLIELHYAKNKYFLTENILEELGRIGQIPVTLIHGSRDVMCLPESSWLLSKCFKNSELRILHGAGHLSNDAQIKLAMIEAIEAMKNKI